MLQRKGRAGAELKTQEPEALTALKVHCAALFIIDFNLQLAELLPKPLVHSPDQPVMSRMRPHYTPKLKKRTALVRALKEVLVSTGRRNTLS